MSQPSFDDAPLIHASTSAVTGMLRVVLLVPVANVVVGDAAKPGIEFHVVDPDQLAPIGKTASVREKPGVAVITSFSVAESAPPLDGIPQLDRSNLIRT